MWRLSWWTKAVPQDTAEVLPIIFFTSGALVAAVTVNLHTFYKNHISPKSEQQLLEQMIHSGESNRK